MKIRILVIGKRHDSWIEPGIQRYQKRLKNAWNAEWVLLPHSSKPDAQARQDESQRILNRLNDADIVILLDERGQMIDTPSLSRRIQGYFTDAKQVVFVIGGAYGVSDELRKRASFIWSLSPLVFPHQIVRLLLIEQLYRAQTIERNEPYHHD